MDNHKQLLLRFVIAATAGLVVSFITIHAGWFSMPPMYLNGRQWETRQTFRYLEHTIPVYQEQHGTLPRTNADLRILAEESGLSDRFDSDGEQVFLDGWRNPIEYQCDDIDFNFTSLGRDGKPGGIGLDCDLTLQNPRPMESYPTLEQYLSECATEEMVLTYVLSGVFTFILCLIIVKPAPINFSNTIVQGFKILVTIIVAIFFGMCLATVHIPTGH